MPHDHPAIPLAVRLLPRMATFVTTRVSATAPRTPSSPTVSRHRVPSGLTSLNCPAGLEAADWMRRSVPRRSPSPSNSSTIRNVTPVMVYSTPASAPTIHTRSMGWPLCASISARSHVTLTSPGPTLCIRSACWCSTFPSSLVNAYTMTSRSQWNATSSIPIDASTRFDNGLDELTPPPFIFGVHDAESPLMVPVACTVDWMQVKSRITDGVTRSNPTGSDPKHNPCPPDASIVTPNTVPHSDASTGIWTKRKPLPLGLPSLRYTAVRPSSTFM